MTATSTVVLLLALGILAPTTTFAVRTDSLEVIEQGTPTYSYGGSLCDQNIHIFEKHLLQLTDDDPYYFAREEFGYYSKAEKTLFDMYGCIVNKMTSSTRRLANRVKVFKEGAKDVEDLAGDDDVTLPRLKDVLGEAQKIALGILRKSDGATNKKFLHEVQTYKGHHHYEYHFPGAGKCKFNEAAVKTLGEHFDASPPSPLPKLELVLEKATFSYKDRPSADVTETINGMIRSNGITDFTLGSTLYEGMKAQYYRMHEGKKGPKHEEAKQAMKRDIDPAPGKHKVLTLKGDRELTLPEYDESGTFSIAYRGWSALGAFAREEIDVVLRVPTVFKKLYGDETEGFGWKSLDGTVPEHTRVVAAFRSLYGEECEPNWLHEGHFQPAAKVLLMAMDLERWMAAMDME